MLVDECFNELLQFQGVIPHCGVVCHPKDIDIYTPESVMEQACDLCAAHGFIYLKKSKTHNVLLKYEGSDLYIFDLISDFNILCEFYPYFEITEFGSRILGGDPILARDLKSFLIKPERDVVNVKRLKEFIVSDLNCIFNKTALSPYDLSQIHRVISKGKRLTTLKYKIKSYLKLFKKGRSIAFLGPDGSGKSYIIELMQKSTLSKKQYMGDWFFTLQPLYNLILKIPTPYNRFIYGFYVIENLIRSLKVWFYKLLGYVVLIDRFPGTNRASILTGFVSNINKSIYSVMPKPDIFVVLIASPDVVHARKQELSVKDIRLNQVAIQMIVKEHNHIILNTEKLDDSLNILLKVIYER